MHFVPLNDLLSDLDYELNILKPDSQPYSFFLYQHEAPFFYSESRIGNYKANANSFQSFLKISVEKSPDLLMTPEYSFPFTFIENILQTSSQQPEKSKLWALGGESITIEDLERLDSYRSENIIILHEDIAKTDKNFLDPIYFLFKANHQSTEKLVLLIQFKTKHMGVWSGDAYVERNNLIQGSQIYIFRNAGNTISLFALVCSEAIEFKRTFDENMRKQLDWDYKPFLILNPQCNPKPNHQDFTAFRKLVLEYSNKEIISLNWNSGSRMRNEHYVVGGKDHTLINNRSSRSGFYIKSTDIEFELFDRIRKNHSLGVYYYNNKRHKHTFLLNSFVNAFYGKNISVGLTDLGTGNRRDGPFIKETYSMDSDGNLFLDSTPVNDQHLDYLASMNCANVFMMDGAVCVGDKEILTCLSSGDINQSESKWFKFNFLNNIVLNEDSEISKRITVGEDVEDESLKVRGHYIDAINVLDDILSRPDELPENFRDLHKKKVLLGFDSDAVKNQYRYNILNEQGKNVVGTIVYLGPMTPRAVDKKLEQYQSLYDYNNKGRVVVYYKSGNQIIPKSDNNGGTFDNISGDGGPVIN